VGDLSLLYPVHTLPGRLLAPAGTVLSDAVLDELISTAAVADRPPLSLLDHGTVKQDLRHFMGQEPYERIFAEQARTQPLLQLMTEVCLHPAVLDSLDYFKHYDPYTYRHTLMVFSLSTLLAQDLLTDRRELLLEAMAGPTHDMGKICVPLETLRKTDPLTRTERFVLEHHTLAGYVLLSYYFRDRQALAAKVAREHHERRDGSGYPLGLPLVDRMVEIVAASDIYDALISPRPYRPTSYDNRTALEELTRQAVQGKLSWEVVQALVAHNRKGRPHFAQCRVSMEQRGTPPPDNRYGVLAAEDTPAEQSGEQEKTPRQSRPDLTRQARK
jgi:HD-GYP domain-containing protein (c-di-GMP phosphodiesterase class II)